MNFQVWKYTPPWSDITEIELPEGAQVVHFCNRFEIPVIWVLVDADETRLEIRRFRLARTGEDLGFSPNNLTSIGTAVFGQGHFVFHLFEIKDGMISPLEISGELAVSKWRATR